MRNRFKFTILWLAVTVSTIGVKCSITAAREIGAPVRQMVEKHCVSCHQGEDAKAGLDLSIVPATEQEFRDAKLFARWVKVYDRVQAGEMPPPDEAEVMPESEKSGLLAHLGQALRGYDDRRQRSEGRVALRRLNRNEYENTMRDLFSMPGLQVKEFLPEDGRYDGFDKASQSLDISAVQLRKYLEAAHFVLDEAIAHEARPMVFKERFRRIGGLHCFGECTIPMKNFQVDLETIEKVHPQKEKTHSSGGQSSYSEQFRVTGDFNPRPAFFYSGSGKLLPLSFWLLSHPDFRLEL